MRYHYTTGLETEELEELVGRIQDILESRRTPDPANGGRPPKLTLSDQIHLTLMLLRLNITEELAGAIFGVSQPTVSVIKSRIEPLIIKALAMTGVPLAQAAKDRPVVVDGTYIPTGSRKQTGRGNYSGKRHCQCVNVQVACDLDGTLFDVSGPAPGARHDAAAIKLVGWDQALAGATWIADTAYIAAGAITPKKKQPGQELPEPHKQFNHQISSFRCVVERCIAHLKNWKLIATGYRRQLKNLPTIITLITKLELYRLGW